MDTPSKIASSAFDSFAQSQLAGQGSASRTASRTDAFSSMIGKLLSDAADRRRERQDDADAAEQRKTNSAAPVRPEPPKPRHVTAAATSPAPQATRKDEAPRADGRPEPKADAKDANPQPRAAESPRNAESAKADSVERPGKDAKGGAKGADTVRAQGSKNTKTADKKDANGADAADDDAAGKVDDASAQAAQTDGMADASDDSADDDTVVVEIDVMVTETTVQLVTDDQSCTVTDLKAMLALGVAADGNATDPAVTEDATAATDEGVTPIDAAQPNSATDPAAQQLAAQLAATQAAGKDAAQAAAQGQPATDPAAKTAAAAGKPGEAKPADPIAELLAKGGPLNPDELKAAEAKAAEAKTDAPQAGASADGNGALAGLPTDDDATLPQNFADLAAAAKAKGADKAGAKGDADAGGKGDGQNPNGNPALAQSQPPQPQAADSLKPTSQSAFLAAASEAAKAAGAEAPEAAKATDSTTPTSTHPAITAMEAPRAATSVDAPQATAHLRPSRGSAGLPMGVQEQVAVHIHKNVSDGNDQFTINLRPTELGRIDIRLEIGQDGRVNAQVAVEKAQTLELLQRDSRNLERALQDAGLKADSNSLNFSLRGEGGNPFQDEGRQGGSGRRGRGGAGGGAEAEDVKAAYTVTLGPGRVDIHA